MRPAIRWHYKWAQQGLRLLLFSGLLHAALCGQVLRIESGVVEDQVIPRGPGGTADLALAGSVAGAEGRAVEARLIRRGIPEAGFDWKTIGRVEKGRWQGKLPAVPAGGPYRIEIRIPGTPANDGIPGVLVGDLWLLAGQSNMEGKGYLRDATPPHALVHSFDMQDHWLVAEEPLHTRIAAADRVYWFLNQNNVPEPWAGEKLYRFLGERDRGAGLGLPFAVELVQRTGIPVGLVPCALGGTIMDQWSPALKGRGGDSLYGATLRRARAAGSRFKGVLWYQGEGDADPKLAPAYAGKFARFISSLREDLGQPDLPFYYVQAGRLVGEDAGAPWDIVREAQRQIEAVVPHTGMVAAVDESLGDLAHADVASLDRLGSRLAKLACRDLFPEVRECATLERGPRPVSAVFTEDPPSEFRYREKAVKVTFASVNGKLRASGRVSGFSIHQGASGPLPLIYAVDIDPADGKSILVRVTAKPPAGAVLRYGSGLDPYCNVMDEADLALPAFGPMEIH
jgi:sialate O-acetylesterase